MVSIPRVITIDPHATVSRMVRAASDLFEHPVVQVEAPGSLEALDEIKRGGYSLLVTTLRIDRHMHGVELARRVRQSAPDTAVVVVADGEELEALDENHHAGAPYVCVQRPVDVHHFMRVIHAGLRGQDISGETVAAPPPAVAASASDFGPVPALDTRAATAMIDNLLTDVGALAVVLSSRDGRVLAERGAAGYLNREQLTATLLPMVHTTIHIGDLVGGHASALQFYDGDTYDVFVLSIGYHHFLSLVFDGQAGARQFGAVTRFGRRAAEDLKALLGAAAVTLHAPQAAPEPERFLPAEPPPEPEPDVVEPIAVRAETWDDEPLAPEPEPAQKTLDPIMNFDPSILDQLSGLDTSAADDLFDPDRLAEIAIEARQGRGPLSYEEARELGIVP